MPVDLNLSIIQKVFVSKEDGEWYTTSVQSLNDKSICIGIPYLRSDPLVLYKGDRVKVKFFGEDASYQFETLVTGQIKDRIPLYVLDMPQKIDRIQQRNFARVPVCIPVKYSVAEGQQEPEFLRATAVNLSGNGMLLVLKNEYQPGTEFMLEFQLDIKGERESFNLKGRIIRVETVEQPDSKHKLYYAGIQFVDIPRPEQDKIVRAVFAKMVKENNWR